MAGPFLVLGLVGQASSKRFYAGNAARGSNEPHKGNLTWIRALRRGCVRFVLLLAPYLPPLIAGRRPCGLWARWVGALAKVAVSLPMLCAHVRRGTLPPTQLGVSYALLKGGPIETSPGCRYLTKKRKCDKGRLFQR